MTVIQWKFRIVSVQELYKCKLLGFSSSMEPHLLQSTVLRFFVFPFLGINVSLYEYNRLLLRVAQRMPLLTHN